MLDKDGYLSDDGTEFTRFVEDKDTNDDGNVSDSGNEQPSGIDDIIKGLNVDELPEAQRPLVSKLIESFKATAAEVNNLKEKAGLAEVLERTVAQLKTTQVSTVQKTDGEKVAAKLAENLKFEDKDYYAPFFKQIADAIDNINGEVKSLKEVRQQDKASDFASKVQSFVKTNKLPKEVIVQMDEIAKVMGPNAYSDLDRLLKYAKADLGIKDAPVIDINKNRGNNRFEMRTVRRQSNVSDKPINTMADAMEKAMDDLAAED
jgi:histidyl-tRNA synthetase